jgi:hypothetical protein
VGIFNICARPNGSETPAFAKPLPRSLQGWEQQYGTKSKVLFEIS